MQSLEIEDVRREVLERLINSGGIPLYHIQGRTAHSGVLHSKYEKEEEGEDDEVAAACAPLFIRYTDTDMPDAYLSWHEVYRKAYLKSDLHDFIALRFAWPARTLAMAPSLGPHDATPTELTAGLQQLRTPTPLTITVEKDGNDARQQVHMVVQGNNIALHTMENHAHLGNIRTDQLLQGLNTGAVKCNDLVRAICRNRIRKRKRE